MILDYVTQTPLKAAWPSRSATASHVHNGEVLFYPADLFCLLVSSGPCKCKKLWKADIAFLVLARREGAGNKLIFVGFFINDAETRARQGHENFTHLLFATPISAMFSRVLKQLRHTE